MRRNGGEKLKEPDKLHIEAQVNHPKGKGYWRDENGSLIKSPICGKPNAGLLARSLAPVASLAIGQLVLVD